ncbi:MAG: hypothetical protein RIR70_2216, partial [Pseudomonadota bacterium]
MRPPKIFSALGVWLLGSSAVLAAPIAPITPEETAALQAKIQSLNTEAAAQRKLAAEALAARDAACYKKVLVSACLDQSRKDDVAARLAIRQLEAESRRLQREIHLRQAATQESAAKAAAPAEAQATAEKAAREREASAAREAEFARREALHQERLEEGKRHAEREAKARA